MKVCVYDPKGDIPWGIGKICRKEDVCISDGVQIVCTLKDHPVIVMEETGDIVYGIECWWVPV